jgi:lambda family phage holin
MHNDPHLDGVYRTAPQLVGGETPMGAVLLSVVMAAMRIAYGGGGWKKMILEGAICGVLHSPPFQRLITSVFLNPFNCYRRRSWVCWCRAGKGHGWKGV